MRQYTRPFTREELVSQARKAFAAQTSATPAESDMMTAVVEVLENYPLINPAADCVRILCDDLAERAGFREVVEAMGAVDWKDLRDHLTGKLQNAVAFAEPLIPAPAQDAERLEFA